jgi:hypothetical protein
LPPEPPPPTIKKSAIIGGGAGGGMYAPPVGLIPSIDPLVGAIVAVKATAIILLLLTML